MTSESRSCYLCGNAQVETKRYENPNAPGVVGVLCDACASRQNEAYDEIQLPKLKLLDVVAAGRDDRPK